MITICKEKAAVTIMYIQLFSIWKTLKGFFPKFSGIFRDSGHILAIICACYRKISILENIVFNFDAIFGRILQNFELDLYCPNDWMFKLDFMTY